MESAEPHLRVGEWRADLLCHSTSPLQLILSPTLCPLAGPPIPHLSVHIIAAAASLHDRMIGATRPPLCRRCARISLCLIKCSLLS